MIMRNWKYLRDTRRKNRLFKICSKEKKKKKTSDVNLSSLCPEYFNTLKTSGGSSGSLHTPHVRVSLS